MKKRHNPESLGLCLFLPIHLAAKRILNGGKQDEKKSSIELIKKILKTDLNMDFLSKLEQRELEMLLVSIRDRVGQGEDFVKGRI